ncbi:MAG: methyltransferase domain-containing protein [Rhodoferax sp.]|nr:methyltransferase domain-containing protein [Rhodoferax sp.]
MHQRPTLPEHSVRGRIRKFIEQHADKLGDDVLEIGSRMTNPKCWWIVNRDLASGQWTGCDMQPGDGVDVVADIHRPPAEWEGRFSGVLCSEVLEHVARPWVALPLIRQMMRPGGWLVVTTLTSFPIHGFPDDFYRYTPSGLALLLEDAGFTNVHTENAGLLQVRLNDHGEPGFVTRDLPLHVFGVAQC